MVTRIKTFHLVIKPDYKTMNIVIKLKLKLKEHKHILYTLIMFLGQLCFSLCGEDFFQL